MTRGRCQPISRRNPVAQLVEWLWNKRMEYIFIRLSARCLTCTFACSALLALLVHSSAFIHFLAPSLPRSLMAHGKEVFVYEMNASISHNFTHRARSSMSRHPFSLQLMSNEPTYSSLGFPTSFLRSWSNTSDQCVSEFLAIKQEKVSSPWRK